MWQWVVKGGWVMLPIGLCSFFSLTIIIERLCFYFLSIKLKFNSHEFIFRIIDFVRKNRIAEAIDMCDKNPFYLTNILKAGLLRHEESKELIKEAMEDVSLYEIPKLEKNLHFLSTIAHISPLLGLLGTVTGLVRCFEVIQQKTLSIGMVNPSDLAGGISEALITTVAGLCVAIPSYLAYNYLVHRVNLSVLEAERGATELLEVISQRRYAGEV